MIIKMTLKELKTGKVWDVSDLLITSFNLESELESSFPGRLNFKLLDDGQLRLSNGDIVELTIDSKKIFKGTIRKRKTDNTNLFDLTAYDSKFLLKSKETRIFSVGTASDRFRQVCSIGNISNNVVSSSNYQLSEYVADAKSLNEIITEAIDKTKKATGKRFAVISDFGVLKFIDLNSLKTNVIIGDKSLLTEFSYENSIEDIVNSIKVIKEDSENTSREIAVAKDNESIKNYGLIQDIQSPDDSEMNRAQMQQQANNELKSGKKETKTLNLTCLGSLDVKSGSTITLQIDKLKSEGLYNKKVVVIKCSHSFDKVHTMNLEVEVL